jgi:hypothetical protein
LPHPWSKYNLLSSRAAIWDRRMDNNIFPWTTTTAKKKQVPQARSRVCAKTSTAKRSEVCSTGDKNYTYGQGGEEKDIIDRS